LHSSTTLHGEDGFFMPEERIVIFANGTLRDLDAARRLIRPDDVLLAADAGASHMLRMGLLPGHVVGDLDSLPAVDLDALKASGVSLHPYPKDKDQTDLELAINFALEADHHNLLIVAAFGGRLDMILSNLCLLTRPDLRELEVAMDDGIERAFFIYKQALISGQVGDTISLLAWGAPVEHVTTSGLRWPLKDAHLEPHETRSISNEIMGGDVTIRIGSGSLLCIHNRLSYAGLPGNLEMKMDPGGSL
jgi:thiamine pyrophosphokinase